jgi:hypothetical protein
MAKNVDNLKNSSGKEIEKDLSNSKDEKSKLVQFILEFTGKRKPTTKEIAKAIKVYKLLEELDE